MKLHPVIFKRRLNFRLVFLTETFEHVYATPKEKYNHSVSRGKSGLNVVGVCSAWDD